MLAEESPCLKHSLRLWYVFEFCASVSFLVFCFCFRMMINNNGKHVADPCDFEICLHDLLIFKHKIRVKVRVRLVIYK